jgi:ankyrin repeat protein
MVQLLLGEGAEVDAFTKYGDTPLHFAISHGHLGVAQALIDAGADLDADNDEGDNPRSLGTKMGITFK